MTDLVGLCRELNIRSANYIVVGGMVVDIHRFARNTEDIHLLIETGIANEEKVLEVLSLLPNAAAQELRAGKVAEYIVVRVCDGITIDLIAKACGHDYQAAKTMISTVVVGDVSIPIMLSTLLWRTKQTCLEKDAMNCTLLRRLLEERGE